jgi:tetratricopeptide (TPR) repeat protein
MSIDIISRAVFISVIQLFSYSAFAQTAEFDAANKLYEQGRYTDAIPAYEKLLQSNQVSAALYFNLGNAFFKSGQIGRAIVSYRQAGLITPRDPDIRANLQFARNQISGPTLLPNRLQRWLGTLTLNEWAMLAAAALWLWLLTLALIQLRPALKPSLKNSAIIGGLLAAALCLCAGAARAMNYSANTAIVIVNETVVRNGPLDESPRAFTVHDGAELRVLDRKDNWLQVSAGEQRIGWLKREQVILVP